MEIKGRMSFHYPEGLAAIEDETGCYHIYEDGTPAYNGRYLKSFGFYSSIATVADKQGYFHIDVKGKAIHSRKFSWSGNYQGDFCSVNDNTGFYHIDSFGNDAYPYRFSYVGDFRYGLAVAFLDNKAFHINKNGMKIYQKSFLYAEPFHKGFAVVKDEKGFFHIDEFGNEIHSYRLRRAEPFYNNYAFCEDLNDNLIRLLENGSYTRVPESLDIISTHEINNLIKNGAQIAIVLRHAERQIISKDTPNWGNDVSITEKGMTSAQLLGNDFHCSNISVYTSPIKRCVQTGESILFNSNQISKKVYIDYNLGSPGIYFDHTGDHEEEMSIDFHDFMNDYLSKGCAKGMKQLSSASEELIFHIDDHIKDNQLTFFISHDLHIACLMNFLGLKKPKKDDWCDYLEGVCVIKESNLLKFRLFK